MESSTGGVGRLLPWSSPEGKPCHLLGDGHGYVSRLADAIESVQLGMAGDLLDHAADLLADTGATDPQIRYLAARLAESLHDVRRVAISRGHRLVTVAGAEEGAPGPPRGHQAEGR